ncbi:MAG: ribose 5-phosphate isomerase A [Chitinophagaceae bacterium]
MDLKMELARQAITFIKDRNIVGLGASSTIPYIIDLLAKEVNKGLNVQLVTSSFTTQQLLLQEGFAVQPVSNFTEIDIYFDGCDKFDNKLNALKSGGGIHTREKLLASMARQFFLVGEKTKYSAHFDSKFPLVIELLPEAIHYVPLVMQRVFSNSRSEIRMSSNKIGATVTDNGNYLLDTWFQHWPELAQINPLVKGITGVVETSLFYGLTHKAIVVGEDGISILDKDFEIQTISPTQVTHTEPAKNSK